MDHEVLSLHAPGLPINGCIHTTNTTLRSLILSAYNARFNPVEFVVQPANPSMPSTPVKKPRMHTTEADGSTLTSPKPQAPSLALEQSQEAQLS